MTMMVKDDWVRVAITDDNVVVELLVRLKQAQATATSAPKPALPALKWGIRQPRSRLPLSSVRFDAKGDVDFNVSARGSPITPLCWSDGSGDASSSAKTDGFEETSTHLRRSPTSRSKEIESTRATCKEHRSTNVPFLRLASSSDSTLQSEARDNDRKPSLDSYTGKAICSENSLFVLPDLNMILAEDDSGPLRTRMEFHVCSVVEAQLEH